MGLCYRKWQITQRWTSNSSGSLNKQARNITEGRQMHCICKIYFLVDWIQSHLAAYCQQRRYAICAPSSFLFALLFTQVNRREESICRGVDIMKENLEFYVCYSFTNTWKQELFIFERHALLARSAELFLYNKLINYFTCFY